MILSYIGGGTTDGDGTHAPVQVGEIAVTVDASDEHDMPAQSVEVPGVGWVTVVVQSASDAQTLAAARIARGDADLYVADCRPVAHAVAAALVAAGLGGGE